MKTFGLKFHLFLVCLLYFANSSLLNTKDENRYCTLCTSIFDEIIKIYKSGGRNKELRMAMMQLCPIFDVIDKDICAETFYNDIIKYMLDNQPNFNSIFPCKVILQNLKCYNKAAKEEEWNVEIDETPPLSISPKGFIPISDGKNDFNVLQLTDFHYDPFYKVGANSDCGLPLCCREEANENSTSLENKAGKWGHYLCDMPWDSIENILYHISENHKNIDYIYITGDYIDHAVWKTSWSHNFRSIAKIYDEITRHFSHIPIYPLLGNHESHPANCFAPSNITSDKVSTKPLYEFVADKWNWLPENSLATLRYGGYYTAVVRPGLRLIALNNNVCFVYNYWLVSDPSYVTGELKWLHDTLLASEKNGEKVHILSHVPSGNTLCYKKWAKEYNRIVQRFWNVISAQFNGHSHRDHFNLHFDLNNPNVPINVAWNGGSATNHVTVNANYRIYKVESKTFQVIDHETWIYNLTEANIEGNWPRWVKEYSFKEAYGISDLSPASLYDLVQRFTVNQTDLEYYWKRYVKYGDAALQIGCDNDCLINHLCEIVSSEYNDGNPRCDKLKFSFLQNKLKKDEF